VAKSESVRLNSPDQLRALEEKARKLAGKIHAPISSLPRFSNDDLPPPRVSFLGRKWLIIFGEDKQELMQLATEDEEEALYWIFDAITFQMAARMEARQRLHAFQSGRSLFATQLKLLETLDPLWAERKRTAFLRAPNQPG
jgi:hypothetical protein